jgi:hypothetical protein
MKLTYSLYQLISLVSFLSCVEVWIDNKFNVNERKNHCETFTEPKEAVVILKDHTPQEESDYNKCEHDLKTEWETLYPVAPNIIEMNGKKFFFITYLKRYVYARYPNVEIEDANILFTRFIYKRAPQLFQGVGDLLGMTIEANTLIRQRNYLDAAVKFEAILEKKDSDHDDYFNYINESLAFSLFAEDDSNVGSFPDSDEYYPIPTPPGVTWADRKLKVETNLVDKEESPFNRFLFARFAFDRKGGEVDGQKKKNAFDYLVEATNFSRRDLGLAKSLVKIDKYEHAQKILNLDIFFENKFYKEKVWPTIEKFGVYMSQNNNSKRHRKQRKLKKH